MTPETAMAMDTVLMLRMDFHVVEILKTRTQNFPFMCFRVALVHISLIFIVHRMMELLCLTKMVEKKMMISARILQLAFIFMVTLIIFTTRSGYFTESLDKADTISSLSLVIWQIVDKPNRVPETTEHHANLFLTSCPE